MKKPLIILIFLFFIFGLKAQKGIDFDQVLILKSNSGNVESILEEVEEISQISFSYSSTVLNPRSIVFLSSNQLTFKDLMLELQEQLEVDYLEFNNKILLIPLEVQEEEFWIDGYIRDVSSGEAVIGATVYNSSRNQVTETNEFGYYSIKVTSNNQIVRVSFLGYVPEVLSGFSKDNSRINLALKPSFTIPNIVITPSDSLSTVRQIDDEVEKSLLISNPGLLGESNVIQSIKLLSGVQSGSEVQGNILVQGGGPDQNLILMDGVPIYEVNHLLGLTSIFNNDAVNSVKLETSSFSSKYGGRLSSVINVQTKDGNKYKPQLNLTLGLLGTSIHAEGPIIKDRTSYLISGRVSYINTILEPVVQNSFDILSTNFGYSDLKLKVNHQLTKNSSISVGAFLGVDDLGFENQVFETNGTDFIEADLGNSIRWNNSLYNLLFNQVVNEKLQFSVAVSTVDYNLRSLSSNKLTVTNQDTTIRNSIEVLAVSTISDENLRTDWEYKTSEKQKIGFGGGISRHLYSPSIISRDTILPDISLRLTEGIEALETFIYAEDQIDFSEYFRLTAGFHFSRFSVEDVDFNSFQPRVSLDVFFSDRTDLKLSYSEMTQFIHLLVNPGTGLPTDLWLPSTRLIQPEESIQYNVRLRHKWNKFFLSSASAYYKQYDNLIDYTSASPLFNPIVDEATFIPIINNARDWEDRVEVGQGEAYGLNIFHSYISPKIRAILSYSYGISTRQFDNINKGEVFPYRFDRRHDLSFLLHYQLNEKWTLGGNWIYGSGHSTTFAVTQFLTLEGEPILDFSQRNNFRLPDYHRLDLTASYNRHLSEKISMTLDMGLYNTYNRLNPYFVYLQSNEENNTFEARQIGIFPILPFFNVKFRFN